MAYGARGRGAPSNTLSRCCLCVCPLPSKPACCAALHLRVPAVLLHNHDCTPVCHDILYATTTCPQRARGSASEPAGRRARPVALPILKHHQEGVLNTSAALPCCTPRAGGGQARCPGRAALRGLQVRAGREAAGRDHPGDWLQVACLQAHNLRARAQARVWPGPHAQVGCCARAPRHVTPTSVHAEL